MAQTRPRGPAVLRTTTFRIAVLYLALFGLSVGTLLSFVYWATAGFMARQADETIRAEITGLAEQYRRDGLVRLTQVVLERSRNQRQSLYLLASPARQPLAGNLEAWPGAPTDSGGWVDFVYERQIGDTADFRSARGRHLGLAGGFHLLVGRDVTERRELDRLLRAAMAWSVALTLALGLVGGLFMSRNLLRRIEAINRTSQDIVAGDLSRRVPVRGSGDELDRLAQHLNAMLDQIENLMNAMRQVTDNVAHDLRSPLTRIRSRLELAMLERPSVESYGAALEQTLQATEQLISTFNALLSIAQVEAGSLRASMTPVDVGLIAGDVADLYGPVAEDKQVGLTVHTISGGIVRGDRHLLSQAVANLVDNAVKYTPPGGAVEVRVELDSSTVDVTISDTGPGIPVAERQRVLDRFVRLETSRHTSGSGLGLSLVRAVAQLHNATLLLEDNEPGLRVRLRLELAAESKQLA